MDEISYSGSSSPIRRKVSKRAALFGLFAVLILVLLGALGFFVTRGSKNSETSNQTSIELPSNAPTSTPEISESPTPEASSTPSKTPTKAPTGTSSSSKSDISVAIENGSGEAGVAAKAASALKSAGYSIGSTGNADNFDYTGVTIQVKASEKSILTGLKSDLTNAGYTISSATSDLSEGQSEDALVIIGK